jgi:hypothetical protein
MDIDAGKYNRSRRGDGSNDPMGGLKTAEYNSLVGTFITPDETKVLGAAFKGAFEQQFRANMESGLYGDRQGNVDYIRAATDAENAVRASWDGLPDFGAMQRSPNGQWFDPEVQQFVAAHRQNIKGGRDKDIAAGVFPISDPTTLSPTMRSRAEQPPLEDRTFFNDNVAPYVRKGFVSVEQLKKWTQARGIPWDEAQINAWLAGGMSGSGGEVADPNKY